MATKLEGVAKVTELTVGNTEFAVAMHKNLAAGNTGNVFFSPFSISSAMAMTWLGARGNTAQQMQTSLGFGDMTESTVHEAFEDYNGLLNQSDASYKLACANRLYCRQDYHILDEFLARTQKHYSAQAEVADFAGDAAGCREKINKWVAQQTADKITDLLPEGCPDPMMAMILVNAIYFKGEWDDKFNKRNTSKRRFKMNDTTFDDKVDFMYKSAECKFTKLPQLKSRAVEIPYKGKDLSFVIILPDAQNGLAELENSITAQEMMSICAQMTKVDIDLCFPKFKLNFSCSLNDNLSSLGMKEVFVAGQADLSGMDGGRQLYLSNVLHQSFIEVNEEGTEAAAATAPMIMLCMAVQKEEFFCDHPFLYFIRDNRSGGILFMGSYRSPPSE